MLTALLQQDREVAGAYLAHGTPAAVVVRPDGTVGSGLALGADAIQRLVARIAGAPVALPARLPSGGVERQQPEPATLRLDDPAPAFELPDLNGEPVRLESFRGRSVALLFWNPRCGFCDRMLPDLRRWEVDPPADAPELLIISGGTIDANRAMGLKSRVVLDPAFAAGGAFGANGTPSAMLVGSEGTIASAIAIGADGVLALLKTEYNASARTSLAS